MVIVITIKIMKHILKKSLKVTFASVLAIKAGDQLNKSSQKPFFLRQPAQALYEHEDIVGKIIKTEFDLSDLAKVPERFRAQFDFKIKTREENLKELMNPETQYDFLIIGGGANGAGVALDAASRGLKCAVIDAYDFASGTSSKSTKMAHGGVRYFEKMMTLDGDPFENLELLKETLNERNYFLFAAPYQNVQLDLVIPSKSLLKTVFYYYPGMMLYHMIYLRQLMKSNFNTSVDGPKILGKKKLLDKFPNLKAIHGNSGVLMHEVQMMDSRMNWHALVTAQVDEFYPGMKGATLANYVEFQDFIKDSEGKITGAVLYDKLKKLKFNVKSKVVVNCAGIHADELRLKDNPEAGHRITGARGTHLMFKKGLLPKYSGIIIPKTKDGRLIFIINYLDHALVGTTDDKCEITHQVTPLQKDEDFIIEELKQIFGEDFDFKGNLVSSWAGIRPLVVETEADKELYRAQYKQKKTYTQSIKNGLRYVLTKTGEVIHGKPKDSTASLSRNHVIEFSPSGLVSLMGGKWTSFRKMGVDTTEMILKDPVLGPKLEPKHNRTNTLGFALVGSHSKVWVTEGIRQPNDQLMEQYEDHMVFHLDLPREVAKHLLHSYGTMAMRVLKLGQENKCNVRLHPDYPFLKSELLYAIKYEMVEKPTDVICRRVPLAFLNKQLVREVALPLVIDMMAKERKWSNQKKKEEMEEALRNLDYMK